MRYYQYSQASRVQKHYELLRVISELYTRVIYFCLSKKKTLQEPTVGAWLMVSPD
jgi:hypothetical protein